MIADTEWKASSGANAKKPAEPVRLPMPKLPDKYTKTDMEHAVEGYCPSCGSNESIDVVEAASMEGQLDAQWDWAASETLHCNKCGKDFEQLYAMKFDGQKRSGTSSYCGYLDPAEPGGDLQEKAEYLVRDLEALIEAIDLMAESHEKSIELGGDGIGVTWPEIADHKDLKRVRQRLLEVKPYLG